MSDHGYDEEAARRELAVYRTGVAARRRAFVRDQLALDGEETVVSVGCGPGFEPAELSADLGTTNSDATDVEAADIDTVAFEADGRVIGVDAWIPQLDI